MKVGLLNLEPKYKNLALEKLRAFYTSQGDEVQDYFALEHYDKVYVSRIFTFTDKSKVPEGAICGGSGFDLITKLPPEIEAVKPHLNFGFTTRGCFRWCPPCIVCEKEGGKVYVVGNLYDLWDGKTKLITLYDNNILAIPSHFGLICAEAMDNKITLDFNQGLDHRLLTPDIVRLLAKISHKEYHFAFDHPSYKKGVEKAIELLQSVGINRCNWYVLVGFSTTFQEDLDRLNYLKAQGQNAYVQRYRSNKLPHDYILLAEWANQHHIFHAMTWQEFLEHPKNRKFRLEICDRIQEERR